MRQQANTKLLQLNLNESPYGPSPKAVAAMQATIENGHLYPDDSSSALCRKLAEVHGVPAATLLISNGTTALLSAIARTLLRPGLKAVTSACSFIVYPMAVRRSRRDAGGDSAAGRWI